MSASPMARLMNMVKRPLILVMCLVLSSCGESKETAGAADSAEASSGGADLVGTWRIDSEATLAANQPQISVQLEGIPETSRAEGRRKLEDIFKGLEGTMDFNDDNSLTATTVFGGNELVMQGTWETDGEKIISRTRGPGGDQIATGTIQGGQLKFSSGDEQFLVLRRE